MDEKIDKLVESGAEIRFIKNPSGPGVLCLVIDGGVAESTGVAKNSSAAFNKAGKAASGARKAFARGPKAIEV